jgi:biotin carboxylase
VPGQRRTSGEVHPSAGRITAFNVPGGNGVRVDTAQYAEGIVPPYYDSLIAKLIVHGKDRAEAMARMSRALEMFVVEGIHTTIPLHRRILEDAEFREGSFDTKFMERFFEREKLAASSFLPGVVWPAARSAPLLSHSGCRPSAAGRAFDRRLCPRTA